jgi:hypothetical protein
MSATVYNIADYTTRRVDIPPAEPTGRVLGFCLPQAMVNEGIHQLARIRVRLFERFLIDHIGSDLIAPCLRTIADARRELAAYDNRVSVSPIEQGVEKLGAEIADRILIAGEQGGRNE